MQSPTLTNCSVTSTDSVVYRPGVTVGTIEECGAQVRWCNGVLEQVWIIRHVGTTGAIEKITNEWRSVPNADV